MEHREIEYGKDICCPFCYKNLPVESDKLNDFVCDHTIFIANDIGLSYIKKGFERIIDEGDYESQSVTISEFAKALNLKGELLAQYDPAPSFHGIYIGFSQE